MGENVDVTMKRARGGWLAVVNGGRRGGEGTGRARLFTGGAREKERHRKRIQEGVEKGRPRRGDGGGRG